MLRDGDAWQTDRQMCEHFAQRFHAARAGADGDDLARMKRADSGARDEVCATKLAHLWCDVSHIGGGGGRGGPTTHPRRGGGFDVAW